MGRVAFDGFGLVPRSFTGFELDRSRSEMRRRSRDEQRRRLAEIVGRSITCFRPAVLAVAVGAGSEPGLVAETIRTARRHGVTAKRVSIEAAVVALLGAHPPPGYDKLAQVAVTFLPELSNRVRSEDAWRVPRSISTRRNRSAQWKACAAGLALLIGERPLVAAALLRGKLPPESPIPALLARSVNRLHPTV